MTSTFHTTTYLQSLPTTRQRKIDLTEHVLSSSSPNDDLSPHWGNPNFNTRVTILSELSGENLVELREEDSISHKLLKKSQCQNSEIKHLPKITIFVLLGYRQTNEGKKNFESLIAHH